MSYVNQDDGITYASADEEYHVTGSVLVRVNVSFYTSFEPGDSRFDFDLLDALDFDDVEIEDDFDLDFEIVPCE